MVGRVVDLFLGGQPTVPFCQKAREIGVLLEMIEELFFPLVPLIRTPTTPILLGVEMCSLHLAPVGRVGIIWLRLLTCCLK